MTDQAISQPRGISDRSWWATILFCWFTLLGVSVFYGNPDDWFEAHTIYVSDTTVGKPPIVRVWRNINQKFRGTWLTEVNKLEPGGRYPVCEGTGTSLYKPGDSLPAGMDLDYWARKKCNLDVGEYFVETIWTIRVPYMFPMEVSITSNIFRVLPSDAPQSIP